MFVKSFAVLASVKVRNLKANHNKGSFEARASLAVLASVKVRNLKANHNLELVVELTSGSCISKCEGTESES